MDTLPGIDLVQIQRQLVTLGYEPGNTDSELDTLTQIAISQFEAEHGMPVTGQPSAALAAAIEAAVSG
jgi:peptidoglycan hydrolase-like protein with peptidoglycan-binding domain